MCCKHGRNCKHQHKIFTFYQQNLILEMILWQKTSSSKFLLSIFPSQKQRCIQNPIKHLSPLESAINYCPKNSNVYSRQGFECTLQRNIVNQFNPFFFNVPFDSPEKGHQEGTLERKGLRTMLSSCRNHCSLTYFMPLVSIPSESIFRH